MTKLFKIQYLPTVRFKIKKSHLTRNLTCEELCGNTGNAFQIP